MTAPPSAEVDGNWRTGRRYQRENPADCAVLEDIERQLAGLTLVDTPVWLFDTERCQCLWANPTGLEVWKADSVASLQARDIAATQSEAVYTLLNDYLLRVERGEKIAVWVTLDPRGTTRRHYQSHHLVTLLDGRRALLIEAQAEPPVEEMLALASNYALTIGLYEIDGRFVSGNPAFVKIAAYQPLTTLTSILPANPEFTHWASTIAEQSQLQFETQLITERGSRVFRCELRQVLTATRQPRALLTLYDLSEQRIAESEAALKENQARTERTLDSAEVATFGWELPSEKVWADHRWWRLLGYTPNSFSLNTAVWASFIHPEDMTRLSSLFAQVRAGEIGTWDNEYRLKAQDGSWRWVLDRGLVTRRDEQGLPLEGSGIHLDIHQHKSSQIELADSELRHRSILLALPDLIVINDTDGKFTDVHAASLKDWGFPSEHPVGLNITQVLPPELASAFLRAQQKVLAQQSMLQGEYRVLDPKLGPRFREFRMVPHGPQQTLTMIRDVTQRQTEQQAHLQVVKQLQQAQKMDALGQLTGGVAHDFNNILASILGYAWLGLQQTNEATNPKMVEYLEVISAAGERGRDLVQKMLAFSRRSSDQPTVAQDPIPALKDAFQILKSLIPSSISLSLEVPDTCPALAIDPTELHQAVVNMVLNSRDAMQGSGEIAIVLHPLAPYGQACASCHRTTADSYIAISVRDNGSGMSSALLDRIFDPFFTTKPVGSGTGIGLAVVEGIVHRLGGHILVETAENRGTEIRLLFPAAPTAERGFTESLASPTEKNWRVDNAHHHLMVVDDEIWIGTFLREFLREEGYSVSVFTDSRAALAAIEAAPHDYTAVITDLTMPHMSGLELAAEIHLRRPDIPIVLCTGADEITNAEGAREVGIFSILPKPIPVVELRALLGEILTETGNARTAKPSDLGGLT